ncbi:MAG: hypothetical protein Q9212_003503 [Teloschistes hypoglaucus]
MAASLPAALRSADISRFAQRAGQLDEAKPSIAYWCNYWIVNQLISKGLHNVDSECTQYTTDLMDKLERTEYSNDDTVMDDMAAQIYVEQFALETFQRAENAMKANKSSRQTADTLAAAVVFLELRQIWEPIDAETASKVKYAKYHALRIAKAIKAGEDPNMSNPAPEPAFPQEQPLDPQDLDVQMLDERPMGPAAYQPSVEEVPDEHDRLERHLAQRSSIDQSLHPSRAPSVPRHPDQNQGIPTESSHVPNADENYYHQAAAPDVSPLQSPDRGRNESIGGGYFPKTPVDLQHLNETPDINDNLDDLSRPAPQNLPDTPSNAPLAPFVPPAHPFSASAPLHRMPPHEINHPGGPAPSAPFAPYVPQEHSNAPPPTKYPQPSTPSALSQPLPPLSHQAVPTSSAPQHITTSPVVVDEEAMAKAQKHARWAISALNFEDVNTAIKELRGALETLGAK